MKTDPKTLGWNAFMDGETKSTNPYTKDTPEWEQWNTGYDDAETTESDEDEDE